MNIFRRIYCRTFQTGFRIALPLLPYRNPHMLDSVLQIPELLKKKKVKSVLLVVDGGVHRLGLTQGLEDALRKAQIEFTVYEQNTPNPTIDNVEEARALYKKIRAKAIVAVGGGSSMDCAKVVGARIARPRKSISRMKGILHVMRPTPMMIAVPTTAGTGSEVTLAAVITDAKTKHKYPINDFALIPDYAVLDPALTLGLPPFITATTGLDALTHAVEAYIGRSTDKLTRSMSVRAVKFIHESLIEAVENGTNIKARRRMLQAAYCAGVAFTRSYVGYIHGIAHSLGGQYGIAHGLANAVILPQFLEIYGKSCEKRLARLARESGVVNAGLNDEAAAKEFISWIYSMNDRFGLPKGFDEIKTEDIRSMAKHADKESNPLYPVPMLMNAKELERVYVQLMTEGEETC